MWHCNGLVSLTHSRVQPVAPSDRQTATNGSKDAEGPKAKVPHPIRPVRAQPRDLDLVELRSDFGPPSRGGAPNRSLNIMLTVQDYISWRCVHGLSSVSHNTWTHPIARFAMYSHRHYLCRFIVSSSHLRCNGQNGCSLSLSSPSPLSLLCPLVSCVSLRHMRQSERHT